ncbi:TPA: hypothetical protein DCZ16_05885 [Candidatus Peregrinibacteria bacterium]|nr:hypothetical protein [Candidatus Peregrinibacteria bacterium]
MKPNRNRSDVKPDSPTALSLYLQHVSRFTVLTRAEEQETAKAYVATSSPVFRQKLINANLRFVVKIGQQYLPPFHARFLDLIQEGNIGLMTAVDKFQPERGYKLVSYAIWWIRAYMKNFMSKNKGLVKKPRGTRGTAIISRLNSGEARAALMDFRRGMEADTSFLTERDREMGITLEVLDRELGLGIMGSEVSLNENAFNDHDSDSDELGDWFSDGVDYSGKYEAQMDVVAIQGIIDTLREGLDEKELCVLDHRILAYDSPRTLQEIGDEFRITRERVRQIEAGLRKRILKRVRFEGEEIYAPR